MTHCYAIASGKGGVGKSAVTANLGAALSGNGHKVVLIDADIGLRSLDALLSLENNVVYDLIDVAEGTCTLDEALLTSPAYPGLSLLPAAQFRRAKSLDPKQLTQLITDLRGRLFDYILIDCPAGIERGLRNVLNAGVDEMILVVTPDDVSLRSAERAVQLIESGCNLLIFLLIFYLFQKRIMEKRLIFLYMLIYPVVRFTLEFFRGDEIRGFVFGLSTSQWISIFLFAAAVIGLTVAHFRKNKQTAAA